MKYSFEVYKSFRVKYMCDDVRHRLLDTEHRVLTDSFVLVPNTVGPRSLNPLIMSMLDKFRKGAQKAGVQATAFVQASTTKVASGSREFVQTFSLPGEAEKAANILDSFLGS